MPNDWIKCFDMRLQELDKVLMRGPARVMAILNVTPDSFYARSRTFTEEEIEVRVRELIAEGADWVDVGGYSSRPGADEVPFEEELARLQRALRVIRRLAPEWVVSIDTFRAEVVRRIVEEFGEVVVNDISAGELDPAMIDTVAQLQLPYIAMHMRGTPRTMAKLTDYDSVVEEVVAYFRHRVEELRRRGIRQLILDPGFGFAKTPEQNYTLLGGLHKLCALGLPVLSALSRKSMIYKVLDTTPEEALNGTTALHWESLRQGARLLRVHDVREAVEVCRLYEIFHSATQ